MADHPMNKLLVIGLDGAPFPLIERWTRDGYLPNLARLIERGAFGVLNSTMPAHSPTAWATFLTGMNPGKHGVFDFVQREPGSYRLRVVRSDDIPGPSLWRWLGQNKRTVGVMNVPMTYPAEQVNGFLISGLGTPDYVPFASPLDLSERLTDQGYRVNNRFFFDLRRQDEWLQDISEMTNLRGQTAVRLLAEERPEFFMVVFRNTDEICHFYWHHMDETHPVHDPHAPDRYKTAIRDLYQLTDEWIGQLLKTAGAETNIVVMSDHGAGPLYQDVFLNEWLWQQNLLVLKEEIGNQSQLWRLARRTGLTRERISRVLTSLNLHRVEVLIKRFLGDRIYLLPRDERPEFLNAIDWTRTKAYSFGYYGQIFINLIGREPEGIVEPGDEYNRLRTQIAAQLQELTHPDDGLPVVDQVYFNEELYDGPRLDNAPDLLAVMRDFSFTTRKGYEFAEVRGQIFHEPYTGETGSHRLDGILIAAGPDIKTSTRLTEHHAIIDLTPTLLRLMDCPVPDFMDGDVIEAMLNADFLTQYPLEIVNVPVEWPADDHARWNDQQEREIAERLKKLGYLG
jgi:predicted AlkP superfamily phosphohydrolase/phosphomutase